MLVGVALRKESVDRNSDGVVSGSADYVALRKESVDRNIIATMIQTGLGLSLSARRAWIEILDAVSCPLFFSVALRKESVDRNWKLLEMHTMEHIVALRKESVDRNGLSCADKVSH